MIQLNKLTNLNFFVLVSTDWLKEGSLVEWYGKQLPLE